VEHVPDSRNFKLKKQVDLTTVLAKELDSTMEEVEFWQDKYKEAMKIVRKLKRHCPQDVETLSDE
jgi:predicted RNA-binding protein